MKFGSRKRKKNRLGNEDLDVPAQDPQIIITSPQMGDDVSGDSVEVQNNRIYFYSEVDRNNILRLNKSLKELDEVIQCQNVEWNVPNECVKIYLHINSFGGHLFDAFSTIDYIRNMKTKVVSVIDGCAASAATLISVACHEREMSKHSVMLIHQLSSFLGGTYEDMKDEMKNCDMFMDMIRNIYKEHTNIPDKKLNKILKHDLWFSSKECLKYKLVDRVI